jgi:hypothetical protein
MTTQAPTRLASEEVIISAPMSYVGSSQRIWRIRRRAEAHGGRRLATLTVAALVLILVAWTVITLWYLVWGILLVPYRLLRRGARKRRVEALRHRELIGTIQGSAVAPASAILSSQIEAASRALAAPSPTELIADSDRESTIQELAQHLVAGRLTTEEFEERLAAAHSARTRMDLDSVSMNLPAARGQAIPEASESAHHPA